MSNYVIGDIQGHYQKMSELLQKVNFNTNSDFLYSVGDIVNRGENSLAVLEWFYNHQQCSQLVLGNHDLYLIRLWLEQKLHQNISNTELNDDLQNLLSSKNIDELMLWLCHQPLFHVKHSQSLNKDLIFIHAGFPPDIRIETVFSIATSISEKMKNWCQNEQWQEFSDYLKSVWKSRHGLWKNCFSESLIQQESYILNCLTQIRWWDLQNGVLWKEKEYMGISKNIVPWWKNVSHETSANTMIFFGHWSAQGLVHQQNIIGLDSGVAWGRYLTIYNIEKDFFESV